MSIKAVSYCRYSTDNQTENSIMYQMAAAEEYCKKHGMILIDVYSDEAKTGTNTNREGLQRLIKDCDTSKFDAIIIYDQSRLSRNISDWFELRQLFSSKGKQLYSCNEQLSSDYLNSNAFLSEGIHALFAQNHVIETRRKTLDGVKSKAKQAGFCGGTPPLGYDIVNGEYVINEKEAPAIRKMFEMYALGKSYDDIMQVLYREGYRSKRGNKISSNAIYYLLRNERYVGTYYWNKYQYTVMRKRITRKENPEIVRIENAIPPIIDKETWTMVQEQLSKNKGASTRTKRQYLLSGLIKCGYCGGTYTGFASKNRRSGEETVYYTCSTKERLKTCKAKNVRGDEIESFVYYTLKDRIFNQDLAEQVADMIISQSKDIVTFDATSVKREISKKKQAINNLFQAIENGLNAEITTDRINTLQDEIKALELSLEQNMKQNDTVIDREKLIQSLLEDAKKIDLDFEHRRAIIRKYVVKIEITDDTVNLHCIGDSGTTGGATPQYGVLIFAVDRISLKDIVRQIPSPTK